MSFNDELFQQINLPGQWAGGNSREGFKQRYRVGLRLFGDTMSYSWSNSVQFEFENPLKFYNVITPNEDGQNEYFVIDHVQLYRPHRLVIMDRWGRQVLNTERYENDWKGEGKSGTYFYHFTDELNGKEYSGWVQVIK